MIDDSKLTPEIDADVRLHIGDDVRALRKARSMTITELAEKLGRSIGWVSQVERGQTNPSIPDIRSLAEIFEIPVSFLFRNELADDAERGFVVRKDARASFGNRQDGLVEQLLSPDLSGDFEIIHSTFEPHSQSAWIKARPTQEAGYLMSGTLTLRFKDRSFVLNAGDSFQFQNEKYQWSNDGDEPAVAVWVISPPVY
ncbi:helix-turn-helix domain-containing protein [Ahrensia kielensis]|uniref:helix-turn-helix domain-containing protein n=1 Tax=Ahrensia kielensis TaxID=76980 RepID=UPI000364B01B|nr:XRE family transcriptional regulator [Ahrensia kielensis]